MLEFSDILGIGHDGVVLSVAASFGATLALVGVRYLQGARRLRDLRIKAARGEARFGILVQRLRDTAIYMLDIDGAVSNWNRGAEKSNGYTEAEIVGRNFECFYAEEDRAAGMPQQNLFTAIRDGQFEGEGWRLRKDGSRFWAHVVIEALRDPSGELIGFAKITRDRTERERIEQEHRRTAQNLQVALTHMANGICLLDEQGHVTLHNDRVLEILEIDRSIVIKGISLSALCGYNPQNAAQRMAEYDKLIRQGGGETITELPNGKVIRVNCSPTTTAAWVMSIEDITERARSEERISHLARHDPLTGLPNRRQFTETLDDALREADVLRRSVAVVNIDLDRFKEINDTFGHAVGDRVLSTLSERFKALVAKGETIGRFGGDEFMAMKLYRDQEELDDFLQRLTEALTCRMTVGSVEIQPGASIGVSVYPADADDRAKLMTNADMAMYRAKEDAGETVCFYEPSMDEARRARRELARDIWTALTSDQFFLNYQVQRQAHTLDIAGYEVLLRWQHPTLGLVPPSQFIPIAEECGAIGAIGEWVLRRACREAAAWDEGRIAVNLSAVQLGNVGLPDTVREILFETGLPPHRLELEVTETAIIADKQRASHVLRQIKAMGVTIAIDDFGTGYSSLETLRSFPFDKIKLDRSFVIDLDTNMQARAFVRAMLALGKSLNIPVLAEGVETENQMKVLAEEGCDQFQGYLLGRPVRLEVIQDALKKAS